MSDACCNAQRPVQTDAPDARPARQWSVRDWTSRYGRIATGGAAIGLGAVLGWAGAVFASRLLYLIAIGICIVPPARRAWRSARSFVLDINVLMVIAVAGAVAFHTQVWQLAVAGALFGIGIGASYAAAASIIVQSVPGDRVGVATGVNANLRTIGSAFGSALTSALVFGSVDASGSPYEGNYDVAWLTMAALALTAAVIVLATIRRPRSEVGMPGRRIGDRELVAR